VSINPHLYSKMPFDPVKDLVPVAAAARVLVFLEVNPKVPANSVQEFLAYMKPTPASSRSVRPAAAARRTWQPR
jgi:tripartite-type tricarboxylate transporter receptor subunit TctC